MRILKIVAGILVLLIVGVAGAAASRPDKLHIERSKVVKATPADVYPYVYDMDKWVTWNPWKDLDPGQKLTFSEARQGVGAWYAWKGNDQVGEGKMSIVSVKENAQVVDRLEFIAPWQSVATVTFDLKPSGSGTEIVWSMDEDQNFGAKVMGLFMDMDAMLGADFTKGLTTLAPMVEADAQAREATEAAAKAAADAAAAAAASATASGTTVPGTIPAPPN